MLRQRLHGWCLSWHCEYSWCGGVSSLRAALLCYGGPLSAAWSWRTREYSCIHSSVRFQQNPSRVRLCGPLGVLPADAQLASTLVAPGTKARSSCQTASPANCCLNQPSLHAQAPALQQLVLRPSCQEHSDGIVTAVADPLGH